MKKLKRLYSRGLELFSFKNRPKDTSRNAFADGQDYRGWRRESALESRGREEESGQEVEGHFFPLENSSLTEQGYHHCLENNIVRFVSLMRSEGIRIGSSEIMDALKALQVISIGDKNAVKTALKATLVKKAADREIFEQTFEHFFALPEERKKLLQHFRLKMNSRQKSIQEAESIFTFAGKEMQITRKEKMVYARLPEEERVRIRDLIQYHDSLLQGIILSSIRKAAQKKYQSSVELLVKERLGYWHKKLFTELHRERLRKPAGEEELEAIQDATAGKKGTKELLQEDMSLIDLKDLPQAVEIIRKMTRRLAFSLSRRHAQDKKHHQLDLRSTMRSSITSGGAPFTLKYRGRKRKRPRLLLLCDVSGSMSSYAGFVLQFIYGLHSVLQKIESFIFSDDLAHISPFLQRGEQMDRSIIALFQESGLWGGGTDLYYALQVLKSEHKKEFTRNTILLLVSDTRTSYPWEARAELLELKSRVKDIVWLNPLPYDQWNTYPTIAIFRDAAAMFPCNTLQDLENVIAHKLLWKKKEAGGLFG